MTIDMNNWKKILIIMSASILSAYLLAGCGSGSSTDSADMETVSIKKDGTIEHLIIGQFDEEHKERYDIDDLSAKAQEKIDSYSNEADGIVLESAEENDGKFIVRITYKSGEDYTLFNRRELFYGTVAEASAQGFSVRNIFSEDGTAMNDTEQIWENHVVFIQTNEGEALDVNVYGKILYTSENVVRAGKNDVMITAGEGDMISCIVFK